MRVSALTNNRLNERTHDKCNIEKLLGHHDIDRMRPPFLVVVSLKTCDQLTDWDRIGSPRRSVNCMTADDPLPGAATSDCNAFCADFKQNSGLPEATNDRLLRIYGTRASLLLDLISGDAALATSFDDETGALAAEIVFAFRHELATTLTDGFLRRTMVGLNSSCGLTPIEGAAAIAMRYLRWSKERFELETASYKEEIARKFCLNPNPNRKTLPSENDPEREGKSNPLAEFTQQVCVH